MIDYGGLRTDYGGSMTDYDGLRCRNFGGKFSFDDEYGRLCGYDEIDGFDLDIMDWMRKCDEKDVNLMKNVIGKS